jgi:hypothetical protein
MLEREEGVVVRRAPAPVQDLAVDVAHRPEQGQGLVDQVGAEVEQHAAALGRGRRIAPGLAPELRPPALEARLEAQHLAEPARVDQAPQGELLGVPAAIVEDGQRHPGALGLLDQRGCGAGRRRQRLVNDDRDSRVDGAGGELDVGVVRAGDDDQLMPAGAPEHGLRRRLDPDIGIGDQRGGGAAAVAGDHGRQLEPLGRGDQRRVEDRAGEPVADQGGSQRHRLVAR